MANERLGIFGGTFDPIHHGHLIAATELRHALGLDRVLLVPNATPPHKPGVVVSDAADRVAMLELAIEGVPWLGIDTVELDRAGPSYTVDTLRLLQRRFSPATLVFLVGEDSLRDLPTWRNPSEIVTRAELGVASRPGVESRLEDVFCAIPEARGRVRLVEIPDVAIASRDLRGRVAEGRPISFQVPTQVERYIAARSLYRGTSDPDRQ